MAPSYEKLYRHPVTLRQRRSEQLATLSGIVEGIASDAQINEAERLFIDQWMDEHIGQEQALYSKLSTHLRHALEGNILTSDEKEEILHHIQELNQDGYYDLFTTHMQEFHGILGGIAADREVSTVELNGLREWMDKHQDLAGHWPFTETDSLVTTVLADGKIEPDEHRRLVDWCASFVDIGPYKTLLANPIGFGSGLTGITAIAPEITFPGKSFCVTGASTKAPRKKIEAQITALGGVISNIRKDLNYLIYCDAGQKAWSYACYGRKVEQVVEYRKAGVATTLIVAERDYWDALADHGIEIR